MTPADNDDLAVEDLRSFVGARDFERSLAFYGALGWTPAYQDDDLALLELGDHRFYLQRYYVREWVENTMLTIVVADAAAWHRKVSQVLAAGEFEPARVAEPKVEPWGATVTYVWDPCGVLLHFTQFSSP
jgi:hypothetical protein